MIIILYPQLQTTLIPLQQNILFDLWFQTSHAWYPLTVQN